MIEANNVSVCYRLSHDRILSLKEYLLRRVRGKLEYEELWAVKNVSFSLRRGDVLGIIGHNGAGKSTLLKVISGILKPAGGTVALHGDVVPLLELGSGFDYDLTGRENIFLNGAILGYSEAFLKKNYEDIAAFSELERFMDMPVRNYSSGMLARLAFSIAATVTPEILIVDEILSVGDADFQAKSRRRMLELMGGGTTVLFVSHDIRQIEAVCGCALWLEHGQAVEFGPAKEVCAHYVRGSVPPGRGK